MQVGSLYAIRGESTEITNYDNDVYLTGERVTVRAPQQLYLDSIAVTRAFAGDLATPNVFPRLHRLSEANFVQILAQKNMGSHVSVSADWSQPPEGDTVRGAVRLQMPGELKEIRLRVESYWRVPDHVGGVGITAERPIGHCVQVGAGYTDIDRRYPPVNGDRYGIGQHYFVQGTVTMGRALSASVFYAHAFHTSFPIVSARRFDAIVTYNVLAAVVGTMHRDQSSR